MRLNVEAAIIPTEKLRDYLLSPTHPIGRYKSVYFRALGYTPDAWQLLERDLRTALAGEARPLDVTEYGQKYAVTSALIGPNGRVARTVAVWIILAGETAPRFVTAYPEE